jgi:4-hydroxy-3-polyprenylbenzoate decarboxylase
VTGPRSLRAFVAALEDEGELVTVEREVDWNLELGAVARRCYETGAPAPLFTAVKGARPDFRALSAPMGVSRRPGRALARIALALGLDAGAGSREIVEALVAARNRPALDPVLVDSGPCQQHVVEGDELDLTTLPIPLLHAGDGGRYLNTLGMVVTRTPDRRWTSWAIARIMLLDARRASYAVMPFQHTGRIFKQWRELGQDMPVALALGVPPAALYAAGMPLPQDMDEGGYAGALMGAPIDVVRCRSLDLEVPAESEIVLEGHVSLTEHGMEGPYGDYSGYVSPQNPAPVSVYRIDTMTHRDDPIYPFSCSGEPADETHTVWGLASAAEVVQALRERGIPVVTGWMPFEAANGWMVVTLPDDWRRLAPDAHELCRTIGDIVYSHKARITINTVIVCEDDVDPADIRELVWAIDGRRNLRLEFADKLGFAFSPYVRPDFGDFPRGWLATGEVWSLLPPEGVERPPRARFADNYPAEIRERVLRHWREDGFEEDPQATRASASAT